MQDLKKRSIKTSAGQWIGETSQAHARHHCSPKPSQVHLEDISIEFAAVHSAFKSKSKTVGVRVGHGHRGRLVVMLMETPLVVPIRLR